MQQLGCREQAAINTAEFGNGLIPRVLTALDKEPKINLTVGINSTSHSNKGKLLFIKPIIYNRTKYNN